MKRTLLSIFLIACLIAGCAPLANAELSAARSRWQSAHVSHYRFGLAVSCFCAFSQRMPLTIEVKDGNLVSMLYNDGSPVPADQQPTFARYQTIDALFDFTGQSLSKADSMNIEYDRSYGFPSKVQIDFIKQAADDELSLFVRDFQVLP